MAVAVLFVDDFDRVLLVEPAYLKTHWELPGGTVESSESPRTAAVREIREDLGLTIAPGQLLTVDWVPPRQERTEGLMLVFDGGQTVRAGSDHTNRHVLGLQAGEDAGDDDRRGAQQRGQPDHAV